MLRMIKEMLAEIGGVDYKLITSDMHMKDDLYVDESDIEDILDELEGQLGVEFEDRGRDLIYVADLIAYVKEVV